MKTKIQMLSKEEVEKQYKKMAQDDEYLEEMRQNIEIAYGL